MMIREQQCESADPVLLRQAEGLVKRLDCPSGQMDKRRRIRREATASVIELQKAMVGKEDLSAEESSQILQHIGETVSEREMKPKGTMKERRDSVPVLGVIRPGPPVSTALEG